MWAQNVATMCIEIEEIMGVQTDFSSILYSRGTNLTHQCIRSIPECWLHILLISEYGHFLDRSSLLDQNSGGPQNMKTFFSLQESENTPFMRRNDYFEPKQVFTPVLGLINFSFYQIYTYFEAGVHLHDIDLKKTTIPPNNLYGIRMSEISELIFLGQSNQPNLPQKIIDFRKNVNQDPLSAIL